MDRNTLGRKGTMITLLERLQRFLEHLRNPEYVRGVLQPYSGVELTTADKQAAGPAASRNRRGFPRSQMSG